MYPKGSIKKDRERDGALSVEEVAGKQFLHNWFCSGRARQAETARRSGIAAAALSKIARNAEYPVGLEYAILIEIATDGQVPAHILCPSRSEALERFVAMRSGNRANG
jgi:hypothetical protein